MSAVICGFQAGLHYAEPDLRLICGDLRFSGRPVMGWMSLNDLKRLG